jgi:hypothetical protein
MARTTVDIDTPLLEELKNMQKKEKKSLGDLISQLVSEALARRPRRASAPRKLHWVSRRMGARVDISDKEALYAALDEKSK